METNIKIKGDKTNWYTLRIANGKENKVKELISYLDNYDKHVVQILVPQEKVVKLKDGKKMILTKNLLPGYILIEFSSDNPDPDLIKDIETTKYCSGFLKTSDKKLISLRKNELQSIIGNIEDSVESVKLPVVGENVIVTDGPFKGFRGIVEKIDPNKKLVEVIVKVFGRETNISLNVGQIDKQN